MHPRQIPLGSMRFQAAEQRDLLTTRQADQFGFGKDARSRMVREGHWQRQANGLYDLAPAHDSLDKRLWQAVLSTGAPSAIGGEAALYLHGLDRRVHEVVVWVPDDRRPRPRGSALVRRDKIGRLDRSAGLPPRIRVEDALVDVGQYLGTEKLVGVLADAVRLRTTTIDRIRSAMDGRRRVRHRARFRDILADLGGIESTLEYVFRRDVERAHGLPEGRRQESVSARTRTDVIYEEQGVLAEVDGRLGHEDSDSAFRDLRRDNAHALTNFVTLRYGSADVRGRPCAAALQLWQALSGRGWPEPFQPCPLCDTSRWTQTRD